MNSGNQLLFPGIISVQRMPNGEMLAKVHEFADEISVAGACDLLKLGKTRVNELCDEGKLVWRWSSDARGKRLVSSASVAAFRERMAQIDDQTSALPL
jgi:hypothetical protein